MTEVGSLTKLSVNPSFSEYTSLDLEIYKSNGQSYYLNVDFAGTFDIASICLQPAITVTAPVAVA